MYLLATENMDTQQDVTSAYHDKKAVDNITEKGSYVYILIPHSRRVKLAPKRYGPFKAVN